MIDFHQISSSNGVSTQTWLNEMKSLVAEDLIEQKRRQRGPRGHPATRPVRRTHVGNGGRLRHLRGRLPLYNLKNDISLTNWGSTNDVLESYAIAYAFGAYLGRNFGGAALFDAAGDLTRSASLERDRRRHPKRGRTGRHDDGAAALALGRGGPALRRPDAVRTVSGQRGGLDELERGRPHVPARVVQPLLLRLLLHDTSPDPPYVRTGDIAADEMAPNSKMLYRVDRGLTGTVELAIDFNEGMDFAVVVK